MTTEIAPISGEALRFHRQQRNLSQRELATGSSEEMDLGSREVDRRGKDAEVADLHERVRRGHGPNEAVVDAAVDGVRVDFSRGGFAGERSRRRRDFGA